MDERVKTKVTEKIVLTIPSERRFRGVATLVLGGVGSRLNLPYERMDDLQLALLSILDAVGGSEVSIEVEAEDHHVAVSVGPLAQGSGDDEGLDRVLSKLVDGVELGRRDSGAEWLTLTLARDAPATA
ncbi:MAG TPA: hypothetical protein VHI12_05870 [Gaiellaceae bacterium]|jgi:hypothetical protein|nr:hypothetical protein [Gaiellaceae bacterium]